jgi:tetratricopeptide (TPR) repeat protein
MLTAQKPFSPACFSRRTTAPAGLLALAIVIVCVPPIFAADDCTMDNAVAFFEKGEHTRAAECFSALATQNPGAALAPYYLGRIALAREDNESAIDLLKKAVELARDDSNAHCWLARAYLAKLQKANHFERGVLAGRVLDHLQRAIELDPDNLEARVSLANYYLNAPSIAGGSKKKARQQAQIITERNPQLGRPLMVQILINDGNLDLAAQELDLYLSENPGDVDTLYQVGMLYQKIERYEAAFAAFEKALTIDADALASLYQIGRTAVFSGQRLERGIECLREYLGRELHQGVPGRDAAHWRLGMLYEKTEEYGRAMDEYRAAISMNPNQESYRESLKAATKLAEAASSHG